MKRVHIIVEGQTEVKVFYSILAPYLTAKSNCNVVITPIKHSGGGIVKYSKLFPELRNHLNDKDKILTTFFDYYGILEKHEFPKFKEARIDQRDAKVGVELMEKGLIDDLEIDKKLNVKNFIPYIQLHEFEALLFSSADGFEFQYDDDNILRDLKNIVIRYSNPEDINDSPLTAPSKRIINILEKNNEKYEKIIDGDTIATIIGIESMMQKCPRFKNWIESILIKINE